MGSRGNNITSGPRIIRNEDNEIIFKFSGTDKTTGKRVVGMEISAFDEKSALQDIRDNGFTVTPNTLLPSEYFDAVMNNTDVNKWDWQDMTKKFRKDLKEIK